MAESVAASTRPLAPILLLQVQCFDRRRSNPLPTYGIQFYLDCEKVAPEQTAELLAVINAQPRDNSHARSPGPKQTVISVSIGPPTADKQIWSTALDKVLAKYRHLFKGVPDNNGVAFFQDPIFARRSVKTVSFSYEYFEDETGTPISRYDMIKYVSGRDSPIIVGDPESILRL